jgi:hypothetical protein
MGKVYLQRQTPATILSKIKTAGEFSISPVISETHL